MDDVMNDMLFRGRETELRKMNDRYEKEGFECVIIYGRRRIGKTSLINEFCKDKPTVLFPALRSSAADNLKALSEAIYSFKTPGAVNSAPLYPSFDAAFGEISELGRNGRLVFVIDEYPYLAKADESISSRLQHLIDHVWKNTRLYVILCGSSMSFMENQVLGYESPLYGRRTAQFRIEPLTYRDAALFYPEKSAEENSLIYGIAGGVPHYLKKLDVRDGLDEALLTNVFESSSYLYEEPDNLLKQELREPAVYNAVIKAIAEGASRLNDIAMKAGIMTGTCSKYLDTLIELRIIKKETPVTEKSGKKTFYRIEDNFFRFWYRFVANNIAAVSSGRIRGIFQKAVKEQLPDFMGLIFEKMCRDYLLYYAEDLPFDIREVGQWWGTHPVQKKEIQIDIIASSADEKEFIAGSCKYRGKKTGIDELDLLRGYAGVFSGGKKCYYYIFSKGGFTDELLRARDNGEVTLVSLEEMYGKKP